VISRIWHGYTIRANAALKRFDQRSQHYEVRERLRSGAQ
jgi:hypothetical protein